MPEIYLMRHAHYAGHTPRHHAPDDAPLSDCGRFASVAAAQGLPAQIAGIVTSPIPRALHTAHILAGHARIPLLGVLPELREWRSPAQIRGLTPDRYPAQYRQWRKTRITEPRSRFGDGESVHELCQRAQKAKADLVELAHHNGTILAVSHKVLLGVLTCTVVGPGGFETAARSEWDFLSCRRLNNPGQYVRPDQP